MGLNLTMDFQNSSSFDPTVCISSKISRIHRMTAGIFRKHLLPLGITSSQVSLLFILTKAGGLSQKQLSDRSKLEKSSLNRNLKRLFENGYLSRNDFPIITITTKGSAFVERIIPAWKLAMEEIRAIIDEDGEAAIDLLLNKMITKI